MTSKVPAARAGETTLMVVAVGVPLIVAGVMPNNTMLPGWKLVPVI